MKSSPTILLILLSGIEEVIKVTRPIGQCLCPLRFFLAVSAVLNTLMPCRHVSESCLHAYLPITRPESWRERRQNIRCWRRLLHSRKSCWTRPDIIF